MTSSAAPASVVEGTGSEPEVDTRPRRARAVFETALIVTGLAIFGFVLPHYTLADAQVRYQNLLALLDHGRLEPGLYSLVGPAFATPLVWLGRAVGHQRRVVELYNTGVFSAGVLSLYLLLRGRLDAALLRRFLLVLVAGSMFAAHVVQWNSEVFTAMTVAAGLTAVGVNRWAPVGWGAVVLGVANTPAAIAGLVLTVGKRIVDGRRLRYGLAVIAAVALITGELWVRNGGPLRSGYGDFVSAPTPMPYTGTSGFSYPFFFGLLSICLSFGKGLLFFAPGLVLPVRRTMSQIVIGEGTTLYRLYVSWLLFLAGLVIVHSPWWGWYGGLTWGPRFMLFASIPAALAIAVRLGDLTAAVWVRVLTLFTLALSIWVGICAAVFLQAAFPETCSRSNYQFEALCHYTPDFSVLWYPLVAHMPISGTKIGVLGYFVVVFGYLSWPLCRSIVGDLSVPLRHASQGSLRGWRW